ncbi:anti-anti-sigma factor [Thalassospira lucentensis]|uniref:Anti-sigma factor antagonist n=2 Tax=Thalassospira TaxID=168934 RepID=A0A154KWA0_9PROT|nr:MULTISPECIES: STAS domain-containing protein [Thalassospira]KZB55607.1 anti-anti-sigma factor [Thalassospira xiamenensis]KZB62050.1 anti-anti-sigma factor [Thalassospira lucentensis]MAZ32172.1 anti-sigma factor antagonist [Thalassospira sp.]MBO9508095.1 STAS domain-containing protein [Thalassospira sp. A3_1]MCH2276333.1 STAS domain-containing protein [Thalassospira sp.]
MNYTTEKSGNTIKVELNGRFTFGDHSSFRKLIEEIRSQEAEIQILDLSGVEFIDSAGLGMLLLARDEGEKSRATVILKGAQGQVKRMLEVARFDTLFKLED